MPGKKKLSKGGTPPVKAYNPALGKKDALFQDWYKKNTLEGQNNITYDDPNIPYDYYSYFKNKQTGANLEDGSVEGHFPDTFKKPEHPTFSTQSIYSTPENPGGTWEGETYVKKFKGKVTKPKGKMVEGGFMGALDQYGKPISQGISLAGQTIDALSDPTNKGAGIASGALKMAGQGAAVGSTFGPVGTLIGAGAGAIVGGITGGKAAKQAKQLQETQALAENTMVEKQLMQNAGNMLNEGGFMPTMPLKFGQQKLAKGGSLKAISPTAVEVQANDPSQTDSVELSEAFVDDGEIIDSKKRVFSDDLKMPSGKSIAKEAKKLEKMKNKSGRFDAANSLVDSRLDALFNYQESMKKPKTKGKYANGGEIDPRTGLLVAVEDSDPKFDNQEAFTNYYRSKAVNKLNPDDQGLYNTLLQDKGQLDADAIIALRGGIPDFNKYKNTSINKQQSTVKTDMSKMDSSVTDHKPQGYQYNKGMPAKGSITKPKKAKGGPMTSYLDDPMVGGMPPAPISSAVDKSITGQDILSTAATFAPNVVNSFIQKKLKGPPGAQLENRTALQRIDPSAQLANATNQYKQAQTTVQNNTGQASNLTAATGNLLATKLNNDNLINAQVNQQNAQIQAQEAALNTGVGVRNTERINQFRQDNTAFANAKKRLSSENVANLSTKILQLGKEQNFKERDLASLEILKQQYKDSGVFDRNLESIVGNYKKKAGLRKGGKMRKKC